MSKNILLALYHKEKGKKGERGKVSRIKLSKYHEFVCIFFSRPAPAIKVLVGL